MRFANKIKIDELHEFVAKCYKEQKFPDDLFMFYENRRDYKDKYRTGIIKSDPKIFFKIMNSDFSSKENEIIKNISGDLKITKADFVKNYNGVYFHYYPFIDTHNIDGYAYLRKKNISVAQKKIKLNDFWYKLKSQLTNTQGIGSSTELNEANKLFFPRMNKDGRCRDYYGNDYEKLRADIQQSYPKFVNNFIKLLSIVAKENKEPQIL